jgi:hypothetical protein
MKINSQKINSTPRKMHATWSLCRTSFNQELIDWAKEHKRDPRDKLMNPVVKSSTIVIEHCGEHIPVEINSLTPISPWVGSVIWLKKMRNHHGGGWVWTHSSRLYTPGEVMVAIRLETHPSNNKQFGLGQGGVWFISDSKVFYLGGIRPTLEFIKQEDLDKNLITDLTLIEILRNKLEEIEI